MMFFFAYGVTRITVNLTRITMNFFSCLHSGQLKFSKIYVQFAVIYVLRSIKNDFFCRNDYTLNIVLTLAPSCPIRTSPYKGEGSIIGRVRRVHRHPGKTIAVALSE